MIARAVRPLALCAVLSVLAFGLSGCGSTQNDAATANYTAGGESLTAHVTNSSFNSELEQLVANKQFTDYVRQQGLDVATDSSPSSAPSKLSSVWLTQVIDSAIISGLVKQSGETVPTELPAAVKSSLNFPLPESVITTLPKDLQKTIGTAQGRVLHAVPDLSEPARSSRTSCCPPRRRRTRCSPS